VILSHEQSLGCKDQEQEEEAHPSLNWRHDRARTKGFIFFHLGLWWGLIENKRKCGIKYDELISLKSEIKWTK